MMVWLQFVSLPLRLAVVAITVWTFLDLLTRPRWQWGEADRSRGKWFFALLLFGPFTAAAYFLTAWRHLSAIEREYLDRMG